MGLVQRRVVAVVTAVALAVSAGCTRTPDGNPPPVPPVTPDAAEFRPGSDGIGDDYFPRAGNGGYDVASYDLDITYDPTTDVLAGVATITATATQGLSSFNLDFSGLEIRSVTVDDTNATTKRDADELTVTPAKGIPDKAQFVAKVTYDGVPKAFSDPQLGGQVGFFQTRDGAIAVGEPQVAASWFPVNDHPRDKATYTIKLTTPDGLAAISNGVLKEKKAAATAGFTTWTWAEAIPMAPYLATMVIGDFRVVEGTHDGLPVFSAVHASLPSTVDAVIARTPEVIDYLETLFGPYPFDALGGIAIGDRVGFALENQTRPTYPPAFFNSPGDQTWVLAHELSHQWFGDSVSVDTWKEIWLNEGFATYGEWMWTEHSGGDRAQARFDRAYSNANSPLWMIPTGAPGEKDMFDEGAIYTRGAMTLHALRVTVGDDAFFKILKGWTAEKKNGNGTTPQFIELAEKVSGKQLDALFNAWLFGKVRPPRPTG